MKRKSNLDINLIYLITFMCFFNATCASLHPMLYFNSNNVPKLRHKAKTTHAKIAKIIEEAGRSLNEFPEKYLPPKSFEKFASKWNEVYGNNLCAFAMYCVLYPQDSKATKLVQMFMDRMASYPDWYVSSSRNVDEVPIGHSLTGFVTAFDFLYERFSAEAKKRYLEKIIVETEHMYSLIKRKKGGWTRQHIHNHAPTNVLATLLGAMVYEVHFPEKALPWKNACIELMEKAMLLFSYVIDGSCDEGVAYGSYTSRGITQYVFLALKHFNRDHTKHPWLKEHFWFFYATVLPGYQRSVGIADSNHNWFYGPESQLVFLDAFVMKNGYGNWLADRIRGAKPKNLPLAPSGSQKWSTIHTEFIFYDPSIKAVRPVLPSNNSLHIFSDWGVVTYGGGQYLKKGNTFLSFKSSALNGEAVADIVDYKLLSHFLKGWANFNPGHEHPDQNSFVFAPNGRYFITEALYSTKLTHLNNVLLFAPADSNCNQPWEGQAGECLKWLSYKDIYPVPRGKIIAATETNGFVFMAGDAVNSYRTNLGLESVQRSLLLLHPEVLIVLDNIMLQQDSDIKWASAYFNNVLHPFHPYRHAGYQGAQVIYPEGPYAFFWLQPNGKSPSGQLQNKANELDVKKGTNYVNVTFALDKDNPTRIAYVFVGPNVKIGQVKFVKSSGNDVSHIEIVVNNVDYLVSMMSLTASLKQRVKHVGFGGYASVKTGEGVTRLGKENPPLPLDRCDVKDEFAAQNFVRSLVSTAKLSINKTVGSKESAKTSSSAYSVISILYLVLFSLFCIKNFRQRNSSKENFDKQSPHTIAIVSLPHSGGELLRNIFENSTDFLYLSSNDLEYSKTDDSHKSFDPCYWPQSSEYHVKAGWFGSAVTEPMLFLNNHPSNPRIEKLRRKFREQGKKGRFVFNLLSGFWNSKLTWLQKVIGPSFRTIVVVRDPRAWIYSLLHRQFHSHQLKSKQEALRKHLLSNFTCKPPAILPYEFRHLRSHDAVEKLAKVWTASVGTMLRNGRDLQIVRFEDLVINPQYASTSIMKRLGLTISLPQLNSITRVVKSGQFSLPYEPADFISATSLDRWKVSLPDDDIDAIVKICSKVMKALGYS